MKSLGTCTGVRKAGPCDRPATRRRVPLFHPAPVCETCAKRIYRQNTVECSAPGCTVRLYPRSQKGRTVPAPWCREDEHRALSVEVLGESGRESVKREFVARIAPDWEAGCWGWAGKVQGGYGKYRSTPKLTGEWLAHRLGFHLFHPGHRIGQELDHRHGSAYGAGALCVSPLHLQPVTQGRNIELRELRRTDPLGYWYRPEESGDIPLSLLVFAGVNGLPLKTPELDYSASWEPRPEDRPAPIVRPAPVPDVPAVPEGIEPDAADAKAMGVSLKTLRDLKLSAEELEKLRARPSHPRAGGR